jgi:hypothetical protein
MPEGYRFDIPRSGWPLQTGAPLYINFYFDLSYLCDLSLRQYQFLSLKEGFSCLYKEGLSAAVHT